MNDRGRRAGLVWPFILITIGVVLLLNNLNLMDLNLWDLAVRIWPAILIAIGLDLLIPRRTFWGSLFALVAIISVLAASVWLAEFTDIQPGVVTEISEPATDLQRASIELNPGVGDLRVGGGAPDELLLSGRLSSGSDTDFNLKTSTSAGVFNYEIGGSPERYGPLYIPTSIRRWQIHLNERIPIALEANTGVGSLVMDLRSVALRSASANFGMGRAELSLAADDEVEVAIDGGVGEVLVRVPAGESVEIQIDRGLSSLTLPTGYSLEGGTARSRGGAGEVDKKIEISLGLGVIRVVEWAD